MLLMVGFTLLERAWGEEGWEEGWEEGYMMKRLRALPRTLIKYTLITYTCRHFPISDFGFVGPSAARACTSVSFYLASVKYTVIHP